MLTRVSKYLMPVGATVACLQPSSLLAASRCDPVAVYEEPKKDDCGCPPKDNECKDTELERMVLKCRQELGPFKNQVDIAATNIKNSLVDAYGVVQDNVCYLRTRAPDEVRIGTIVAGGLFGMMFGFRRGLTRKLFFGSLGAVGTSYIVYPEETKYYIRNGIPLVQKYALVAYHFAVGAPPPTEDCAPKKCGPAASLKAEKEERNLGCKGYNGPSGPTKTKGGFFSMFGGGNGGDSSPSSSGGCPTCGKPACVCNESLTEHLKQCCGLGNLPPLIEKCDDIPGPGFRDRVPKSTCSNGDGNCGAKPKDDGCFACGKPPPRDDCAKPKDNCAKPKDVCPPKEDKCECKGDKKPKCPPMPITDCSDCKPAWMSCSPTLTPAYPIPEGVEILPISVGGRNGTQGGACGKCGQDKSKESKKPKVSPNCPMMKPRCPGTEVKEEGFLAKLTALFGGAGKGGEESSSQNGPKASDSPCTPLEAICKVLKVEDEKIRHHRDVFDPKLIVRKDGYMCPFFKQADCSPFVHCQQECGCEKESTEPECPVVVEEPVPDCSCGEPEPIPEPDCREVIEEEVQEDECGCGEGGDLVEEEEDDCIVEDIEGECIVDDYDEGEPISECDCECEEAPIPDCSPPEPECSAPEPEPEPECPPEPEPEPECPPEPIPECPPPLEPIPDFKAPLKCDFKPLNQPPPCCQECAKKGQCSCVPMSNFIIRIQAPFSDGSCETCESILDKLCSTRGAVYPEPNPLPAEECIKVLEIKEEPPTCSCTEIPPPPTPQICEPEPEPECVPVEPTPPSSCPQPQEQPTCCPEPPPCCPCPEEQIAPPKETPPSACEIKVEIPPPSSCSPENPPPSSCPPENPEPPTCPCAQDETPPNSCPPDIGPPENKTDTECINCGQQKCCCNQELRDHLKTRGLGQIPQLDPLVKKATALEMCREKLNDLVCDCPACKDARGDVPPWTPPPPPPCPYCGATIRGENENCVLCEFTRRARDPNRYDYSCPNSSFNFRNPADSCFTKEKCTNKCDCTEFDLNSDGTAVYEGGMCLTRAMNYLWKTNPVENSLKKMGLENQCYDGFKRCRGGESEGCEEKVKYKGGMSIDEYREFIWKTAARPIQK